MVGHTQWRTEGGERGTVGSSLLHSTALHVTLPRNVGLDVDPLCARYTFSKGMYTRTFPKSRDTVVTRPDDTWTQDNDHLVVLDRERERALRSHRVEEECLWRFKKTKLESLVFSDYILSTTRGGL